MSGKQPRKKLALDLSKSSRKTNTEMDKINMMSVENESNDFKKLEKVIELLDVCEQKICRLVCKIWNEVATSVMIKQDRCQISMECLRCLPNKKSKTQISVEVFQKVHNRHYGQQSLHHVYDVKVEKSLNELTKCINNSVKFPCVSFGFTFCNLSAENVMNFFAAIGPQIKTLRLHELSYGNRTPLSAFMYVLQIKAPNVETLQLNGFDYKWTERDQLSLPSLTHLIFETHESITGVIETKRRILQGANNLKAVDGFQLSLLYMFEETEKIEVINSFTFCIQSSIQLDEDEFTDFREDLEEFANCEPSLRFFSFAYEKKSSLNILDIQKSLAKLFNSILESSKDSLEELEVGDWYYMTECEIPRLRNLKKLSIVNTRSSMWDGSFFPAGINLCKTFPNITYLCLRLNELNDENWIRNISIAENFVGQLSTVKTLSISKLWEKEWLKTLHKMCPNFENLIVTASSNLFVDRAKSDFFARICDLWPHLKGLVLIVTEDDPEMPNFDTILTGLTPEDCKIALAPNRYGAMKLNPSILDLKDLKSFKLLFDLKTDEEWSTRKRLKASWETISMISVVHGFKLIQKLNVTIGWNRDQDAYGGMNINEHELSESVKFVHWSNQCDIY